MIEICPRCKVKLDLGYAIDPKWDDNSCCHGFGGGPHSLKADEVRFVFVNKCPSCGHSEKIDNIEEFIKNMIKETP